MDRKVFGAMEMELHTLPSPDAAAIICFSLEIGEKEGLMEHFRSSMRGTRF